MFEISDVAKKNILARLEAVDRAGMALRVSIAGRSHGEFVYHLGFIDEEHKRDSDLILEANGIEVVMDPRSAPYLEDARLDYVESPEQTGFQIDNPNPLWHEPLALAVQEVIDSRVNPGVAMHGGQVILLEVKDDVAYIAMGGGCQGCGLANVTLKQGVEKIILETVPEIRQVLDTTDHAGGKNPYFRGGASGHSPYG